MNVASSATCSESVLKLCSEVPLCAPRIKSTSAEGFSPQNWFLIVVSCKTCNRKSRPFATNLIPRECICGDCGQVLSIDVES